MIEKQYYILLLDDHPLITKAYRDSIVKLGKKREIDFHIITTHDFPTAINELEKRSYDLVFIDIQIPADENSELISGDDLGSRIRDQFPNTKIVISTTFNDHYRIHSIIEHVNPDGFLIKSDITTEELKLAIWKIITNPPYYSKTVVHSMRQFISNDFILDKTDRNLLYYLAKGASLIEIAQILSLSRATIVKRKQHLKEVFDVGNGEDWILLEKARDKGFI